MSKDLDFGVYPDEQAVYEVSDISLSSCDFKEFEVLRLGIEGYTQDDESLHLSKKEIRQLQHRYRSFRLNWRLNTLNREKLVKRARSPSLNHKTIAAQIAYQMTGKTTKR